MAFLIGGYIALMGNNSRNLLLIILGFGGMAGSYMLFRQWMSYGNVRYSKAKQAEKDKPLMPPNSLIIHKSRIDFAYVENPLGMEQKCWNDGQYYYVMKEVGGNLEEFTLPDDDDKKRYYDPAEFANPVTMPSNKKYFTWSASTLQKVSIGLLAIIVLGLVVGLIATG